MQVWAADIVPRAALHFQQTPAAESNCRLLAARFLGRLPIEAWRMDVNEADLSYIRSIVSSLPVNSMERPPAQPVQPTALPPSGDWVKVAENSSLDSTVL